MHSSSDAARVWWRTERHPTMRAPSTVASMSESYVREHTPKIPCTEQHHSSQPRSPNAVDGYGGVDSITHTNAQSIVAAHVDKPKITPLQSTCASY